MTGKAQTPRSFGVLGALFLAVLALGTAPRLALAQDAAGADSSAAAPSPAPVPETVLPAATAPDSAASAPARAAETNPRSATIRKVRLKHAGENVIRTGPGGAFAIAGVYPEGSVFEVIAKSDDWYNVRLSPTETGWVHRSLCQEFDDLSDLQFRPNPKLFTRTGTYVVTGYAGAYSFDRKSNSAVFGGRLGYYMFDRVQVEGGLAWTHINRPAEIVESLFGLSLEAEKFDMLSYHFNVTYEILPGRQMVPYASAGVGSTLLLGQSEPGFNFGAGTALFLSKKTAMRWEFRWDRFHTGPSGARTTNNNVQFTIGTSVLL
jgi:outer membrane beta-barrel protein